MRLTGKVSEFNRSTGHGVISSQASRDNVKFHTSQILGGTGKLDAGAYVEFEVGFVDGVSQAVRVTVISRLAAMQKRAIGKPVDEENLDFIAH